MRALTLTQPWCGLVASGLKRVENRPRSMIKREDFGKPFALHASREIKETVYDHIWQIAPELHHALADTLEKTRWYQLSRIASAVIAVATIDSVVFDRSGLLTSDIQRDLGAQARWWFADQFGYILCDIHALTTPVPCRGWQGFWALPAKVERDVVAQLGVAP